MSGYLLPLLLVSSLVFAASGDELSVLGNTVNLREGPSTDHTVALKLAKGQKLFEIQREGEWVEVWTGMAGGKSGWIHVSLVTKTAMASPQPPPNREVVFEQAFDKFRPEFAVLNEWLEIETGNMPFTDVEYTGNGVVRVMANATWLDTGRVQREKHLTRIFELWNAVVEVGLPVTVEIVDNQNERLMVMFR